MTKLNFDIEIFNEFAKSYEKHSYKQSKYWYEYVKLIIEEIKKINFKTLAQIAI